MRENNIALKQAKKNLEMAITELEATNQMLKDEHQALQVQIPLPPINFIQF